MDRGAWWATVHGVTKSRTQLKQLSTDTHTHSDVILKTSPKPVSLYGSFSPPNLAAAIMSESLVLAFVSKMLILSLKLETQLCRKAKPLSLSQSSCSINTVSWMEG